MEGQKVDTILSLKFDGKNFLAYKEGLKAALRARECWKILIGKESKPEKDGTDAAKKKRIEYREKVLLLNDILTNTLDDGTRVRLAHLKNRQDKWATLVDDFEKKSFAVALFKRRELLNVEFDPERESIRDYIHRVEAIRQELTLMNEDVSDKEMITALLTGLGEKYESMVETFDNLDDYSLQQVKIKLTSREERLNQAKAVTEAKARKRGNGQAGTGDVQFGGTQSGDKDVAFVKKRNRGRGGGRGQQKRSRAEIDCYNCGKFGHYAYECRAPKRDQQQGGKQSQGKSQGKGRRQQNSDDTCEDLPGYYNPSKPSGKKAKPVKMIEVVEEKALPCFANPEVEKKTESSFYIPFELDNASGVNICGCRDAFVSLTSDCDTVMKWFENTRKKAQMKGWVKFSIIDALTKTKVWITLEALYVEGATNLLSQRALYKDYGYSAQTSDDQEVTTLTNRVKHCTWKFDMVDGLYQTMVEVPRSHPALTMLQSTTQPTRSLRSWNHRLAHANWQVIQISKPSMRHLRPFGCLAMKVVDKVYRKSKLSMKGAPALMVGYATQTKGYRLLDMTTGVISEHRHENVKFYEETTVDRWYVEKLLNELYRLRRRPSADSSKLPLVQLPVVDVDEPHADRGPELRSNGEVEMSPAEANLDDQEQENLNLHRHQNQKRVWKINLHRRESVSCLSR